ncbi:MAG TPA: FliM/FliN family flagellar motor switch protein [Acidimicrobiales bacterium]|nr:FliM/FliN family flagellar motor switch protein [Acidimicrobiales bacterium]
MSEEHGARAGAAVLEDDSTRIRLFDFSRQETIERGRLRLLRPMLEAVAGRVTSTLSSDVRQVVHVTLPDELVQSSWEDYAPTLPDPTYVSTAIISPAERRFVLHLPVGLAFLIVDYSLGGDGLVQPEREDLTDIERALLRPLVTDLWRDSIVPALSSFLELGVSSVQTSNSPIFVQVGRPGEICLIAELGVTLADSEPYTVALAMPVSAVNPVIESVERAQSGEATDANEATVAQVERRLQLVPVELLVSYPSVRFTPSELVGLHPGDVLPLRPRFDDGPDVLELLVGDACYAHGVLVEDGRNLAVSVTTIEERTQ